MNFNLYPETIFVPDGKLVKWNSIYNSEHPVCSLVMSQLGLGKWKLHVQIECQLGFLIILIWNDICQYEGKYAALNKNLCHFLGPSPSVISRKKIQRTETYTNDTMMRSGFFPGKHARFEFFQGFMDKG